MSCTIHFGPLTEVDYPGGPFGHEPRKAYLAFRFRNDNAAIESCYIARANMMESDSPGVDWVAWADGEYSLHYVHPDALTAARYVLDETYGTELA